jgi:hypothetical protein
MLGPLPARQKSFGIHPTREAKQFFQKLPRVYLISASLIFRAALDLFTFYTHVLSKLRFLYYPNLRLKVGYNQHPG